MIDAARGEAGPWCGPRDHWVASLHLDDAATAVVAALAAPVGSYHVTDEPVTWGEFAEALGEAVDGAPWLRVPERSTTRFGEGDGRSRPVAAGIESSLPHGDRLGARYRTVRRAGPPSSVRSNGSVSDTRAADRAQHAEGRASTKSNQ
jgi:hypothetical protein